MQWELWLSRSDTGRNLRFFVRLGAGLCILWGLYTAYSLWSDSRFLSVEQGGLVAQRQQAKEMSADLDRKRSDASRADKVEARIDDSDTQIPSEVNRQAILSGSRMVAFRLVPSTNTSGTGAAANKSEANAGSGKSEASAGPGKSGGTAGAGPSSDGWNRIEFECSIEGRFETLIDFLGRLAASPYVVDLAALQITRAGVDDAAGTAQLRMKMKGAFHGRSEQR